MAMPVAFGTATDVATFEGIALSTEMVIFSKQPPDKIHITDLINSLNGYENSCGVVILVTYFMLYFFLKKCNVMSQLIDFIALIFHQCFEKIQQSSYYYRTKYAVMLFFVFIMVDIEMANFSADLTVVKKSPTIDTYNDLVDQNVTVYFVNMFHVHDSFRGATSGVKKKVWDMMIRRGEHEENILKLDGNVEFLEKFSKVWQRILKRETAFIGADSILPGIVRFVCALHTQQTESLLKEGNKIHTSRKIDKLDLSFPISHKVGNPIRNRIRQFHQWLNEFAILDYFVKHCDDVFPEMGSSSAQCEMKWYQSLYTENESITFKVIHYKLTFALVLFCYSFALFLFLLEKIAHGLSRRKD